MLPGSDFCPGERSAGLYRRLLRPLMLCGGMVVSLHCAHAIDLQGHRGARGLAPENTLAGFRIALGVGVTTLETDLALTRDGVLVLSHEPRLASALTRGPDGTWLPEDGAPFVQLDHGELERYDIGRLNPSNKYASQWPDQKPFDGERIPTLASLFALVREARSPGGAPVRLNIETKVTPGAEIPTADSRIFAQAVVEAVRSAGLVDRVTVQSFDWRTLREVRRLEPRIATSCLTIESGGMNTVRIAADGASPWHAGLKAAEHGDSLVRLVKAAGCSTCRRSGATSLWNWSPRHMIWVSRSCPGRSMTQWKSNVWQSWESTA
jgi:glycerophosphoryl diester phosphodiesterase